MTIFCDHPRGVRCDLCLTIFVHDTKSDSLVSRDAELRRAGWMEYAPRFVGRAAVAPTIHACGYCMKIRKADENRLREMSIDDGHDGKLRSRDVVERAKGRVSQQKASV